MPGTRQAPSILWFRRDLRLTDNPALADALATSSTVIPVYVHDPQAEGPWAAGAASRWWLAHSLRALAGQLEGLGSRLVIRRGAALETLTALASETGAASVHWNRLYEPAIVARDKQVKHGLGEAGLHASSSNGHLLLEPWTIANGKGDPYRVFTPFWRACSARLGELPRPLPAPDRLPRVPPVITGLAPAELELAPEHPWTAGLEAAWTPGERGAERQLARFVKDALASYHTGRDQPDRSGTSRLSPHLHFGEISPRQVFAAVHASMAPDRPGAEAFLREIGWREFAHHLLYHFPHTSNAPLDARFDALEWRDDPEQLRAWRRGATGYPIVDAGMRELWETGWMHNRVRMITASLLTKNLFMNWRLGAQWFWDTLVDADLASNTLGWQWAAGCGADAAPYYRIFNPVLQAEKFDTDRKYIRRWVPELARLPDRYIHRPWEAPSEVLEAAGVSLGRDYPRPLVDPRSSRNDALKRFEALKRG